MKIILKIFAGGLLLLQSYFFAAVTAEPAKQPGAPNSPNSKEMENVNTEYNEFSPSLSPDGSYMVFSSKRGSDRYADIYISQKENGKWAKPVKLHVLNSPYNDEAPYISSDGKTIVFSSDRDGSYELRLDAKNVKVSYDIYYSKLVGGQWGPPAKLPGDVNTGHHERAPSISADLKTLYFSRWESGKIENAKLMYAVLEDGSYVNVKAFPEPINTGNIEVALVPDGKNRGFFFSSARPGGVGNLDLYYVSHRDGEFGVPVNLGPQINSPASEAYFSIHNNTLYFCSDRKGGKGNFDIYSTVIAGDLFLRFLIVDEKTKEQLPAVVKFAPFKMESSVKNTADGKIILSLPESPDYVDISIEKEGYLPYYKRLLAVEFTQGIHNIELQPIEKDRSFVTQAIYFDYNSDIIKEESYPYLDQLAAYLKLHPNIRLQIIGHTDLQGDDEFNMDLSKRRAIAVQNYLYNKGVGKNRLEVLGAGKSRPVINERSPRADRLNRRTEFKVIDI